MKLIIPVLTLFMVGCHDEGKHGDTYFLILILIAMVWSLMYWWTKDGDTACGVTILFVIAGGVTMCSTSETRRTYIETNHGLIKHANHYCEFGALFVYEGGNVLDSNGKPVTCSDGYIRLTDAEYDAHESK